MSRTLDQVVKDGLNLLADAIGTRTGKPVRPVLEGSIDRWVRENVPAGVEMTAERLFEEMGILKKAPKARLNAAAADGVTPPRMRRRRAPSEARDARRRSQR